MIDWRTLLFNAMWIAGLAAALAALSWASWRAAGRGTRFREEAAAPGVQTALNLAGALFSGGLAGSAEKPWELWLWILLAGLFLAQAAWDAARRWSASRPR